MSRSGSMEPCPATPRHAEGPKAPCLEETVMPMRLTKVSVAACYLAVQLGALYLLATTVLTGFWVGP